MSVLLTALWFLPDSKQWRGIEELTARRLAANSTTRLA
jgi:hypothetical protein